ncbi:hypothetical protein BJV78DRAFT_33560 [Lactifluus subvellereus]|nr:hypothetical protein BJV78DRAFT_33560 [Lactifluus subvellereus]
MPGQEQCAMSKLNGRPGLAKAVCGCTRPQLWTLIHERGLALEASAPYRRRGSAFPSTTVHHPRTCIHEYQNHSYHSMTSIHTAPEFDFLWWSDASPAEDHTTIWSESSDYVQPPAMHDQLRDQHLGDLVSTLSRFRVTGGPHCSFLWQPAELRGHFRERRCRQCRGNPFCYHL